MGLKQSLSRLGHWLGASRIDAAHRGPRRPRICRFEEIESRRLMAADLHVAASYYDPASGLDTVPNVFQIEFKGGAADTQLTHLRIDGNKDGGPLTFNDAIFDTAPGGLGAYGSSPFHVVQSNGFQVTGSQVADGGTSLDIYFSGFKAGMVLVFTIDVDQVLFIDPASNNGDVDVDAVDEGAEFQRSHFVADFTAPHYQNLTTDTKFWDVYDANFAADNAKSGVSLDLPADRYTDPTKDQSVLTAGATAVALQQPLPDSIAGVVFADANLNNHQDSGDPGIAGVTLTLYQFNGQQYVSTGRTTVTDAHGNYKFANVDPGQYRVVETQPSPYFSVGATAGKVAGVVRGTVTTPDIISDITLLGGEDSVHNDFAEALPNSLAGHVGIGSGIDDGGCANGTNPPIPGVTIQLLNSSGTVIATTTTDSNGNYLFDDLAPGIYTVREIQPVGFFEGDAHVGSAGGMVVDIDTLGSVQLVSAMHGTNYNFCELLPVSIAGHVGIGSGVDDGGCANGTNPPIPGVTIQLRDSTGKVVATTKTDAAGNYLFDNLAPGTYTVHEIQPVGYFEGDAHVGSAGGTVVDIDTLGGAHLINAIHATNYNFCELLPVSIAGHVGIGSGVDDGGCANGTNPPIPGVTIRLLDSTGKLIATTKTDAAGNYSFDNLAPGTYTVHEIQPVGYFEGDAHVGSAGGTIVDIDTLGGAHLINAIHATNYNFCELLPVSIAGHVGVATGVDDGGCANGTNPPIPGVTIQLFDSSGALVATTTTDDNGNYLFDALPPGTYTVHEIQPDGYFEGDDHVGSAGGTIIDIDTLGGAQLVNAIHATNYNFCEIPPAQLCGYVYVDLNNNGVKDAGEQGIPGATLALVDANGNLTGQTTTTDATGHYCFMNLMPGTYGVAETQPAGYYDGLDAPGTAGGVAHNPGDLITGAVLPPGVHAEDYDFGELLPTSLSGHVGIAVEGECGTDLTPPIAGVVVDLLDADGNLVATATTDASGNYYFTNLAPGTYSVREIQPAGYFDIHTSAGSVGGDASNNFITTIVLSPGVHATDYDFCEAPPSTLSGFVFQDGPPIEVQNANDVPDILNLRDGKLTPDDTRLPGITLMLVDGVTGQPIMGSVAMTGYGYDPNLPITTITDQNGHYEFAGLPPGVYGVFDVKPAGYIPAIDTPGSLGGVVISTLVVTDPAVLAALANQPFDDAIVGITLLAADNSTDNNFSVVKVTTTPGGIQVFVLPQPPGGQQLDAPAFAPEPGALPQPILFNFPLLIFQIRPWTGQTLYTWHLSVVDAGQPRQTRDECWCS